MILKKKHILYDRACFDVIRLLSFLFIFSLSLSLSLSLVIINYINVNF